MRSWDRNDLDRVPPPGRAEMLAAVSHVIRHAHDDEDRDALLDMLFRDPSSRICPRCRRRIGIGRSCVGCGRARRAQR